MKCILVWALNDYSDNGGGLQFEEPETIGLMDLRVNELLTLHGDKFSVVFAGEVFREVEYAPKDVVKTLARKD